LPQSALNRREFAPCPGCASPVDVEIFPAFFRTAATGKEAETSFLEGESTCFYHPQKKAVLPCEGCGRFLCALCDCELHGQHFCPACLEVGRKKGKIKSLENERTRYDSIALALAIAPMIIPYLTFISAPVSLFIAIRYWNAPRSIVHRTRVRLVFAIIISSLQIIGWILVIYFIVQAAGRRG
jgi:hypothetical protein